MANNKGGAGGTAAIVTRLAQPVAEELGLLLWDVRFLKEGATWILRIVIDREDTPVSIDDCVAMSRRMNPILDEEDPIAQSYCLEVTSPGACRELTRPEHFAYYEDWPVELRLYHPLDGVKEFAGLLRGWENGVFEIEEEDGTCRTFDKKDVAAVHAIDEWDEDQDIQPEDAGDIADL